MKVWKSESHLPAIARAFTAHNQVTVCILEHEGDNNNLSTRGGLSFGIRCMCMKNEEGDGMIHVLMVMVEGETIQVQLVNK